jgi:tRNA (cytidine/uridine-2'-O-)-methyltransferase
MDYIDHVNYRYHTSWTAFNDWRESNTPARLVLLTTKGATPLHDFEFKADDLLLFGREGAGVPDAIHQTADARVLIPMNPATRSLNLAQSAAITLAEALRQTAGWPSFTNTDTGAGQGAISG